MLVSELRAFLSTMPDDAVVQVEIRHPMDDRAESVLWPAKELRTDPALRFLRIAPETA